MTCHRSTPYECPRCNYKTQYSTSMYSHLYNRKKTCPGERCNMPLTEEVKQIIMKERIYHVPVERSLDKKQEEPPAPAPPPPPPPAPTISIQNIYIQINTIHNVNNYLDVLCQHLSDTERLSKYIEYKDTTPILCLDEKLQDNYSNRG